MNSLTSDTDATLTSSDELRAVVGNLDDGKVMEILNLQPTKVELEEAAIWASGDGDVLGKSGHPMSQKVAEIVEILTLGEDDPSPER